MRLPQTYLAEIFHRIHKSRAVQSRLNCHKTSIVCAGVWMLLALTGCTTPHTRARERASVLGQLATSDQRLVLSGHVRLGLSQEAVYIAWGPPTQVQAPSPEQGPFEAWRYTHTFYGPGGGFFGSPRGLVYSPARGRYHYDGDNFYPAPVYIRAFGQVSTELPYKSALFDHGKLVSFETQRDEAEPAVNSNQER